jgi:hypothetical protein
MFRSSVYGSVPGFSDAYETYENVFRWGRDGLGLIVGANLSGAARDAGNTPTTKLRPGLLLGKIAASEKLLQYSATATDGTDQVFGVLMSGFNAQDLDANNTDRFVWVLVGGPVMARALIGLDEYARGQMAGRFVFDDRNHVPNFYGWRGPVVKAANYTVVNGTDNMTHYTTRGAAGAVTFTLPTTITKGQRWRFTNEAGQNMIVAAPAGKLVTFNNLAATSVAFQTAGNLIGGTFEIVVNDDASKYLALPHGANTVTVA